MVLLLNDGDHAAAPANNEAYLRAHGVIALAERALAAWLEVCKSKDAVIAAGPFLANFLRLHHPRHPGASDLFERLDVDGSDTIEMDELVAALAVHGRCASRRVGSMWATLDSQPDGKLTRAEFASFAFEFPNEFHRVARVRGARAIQTHAHCPT